ncbi:MAG: SDR family NAD(P)-dependent oxidoreductase [Actinobacteria bacterium]|nr:SDR family NAD(P)-dependent oxidoreductase [Actinomycetota bacterium]MBV9663008.1 SDR family NAD(P)-dependent oxidoreductase [Actinomycetota bacterium]MBV9933515.1 SDR family NAD(P)-dependent oxidoreductase [Actinomycetota bacterium]
MGLLDGKVAVVTGGASGIGQATARRFAAEGASVVVADRAADAGEVAAKEIDGRFVAGDVGEPETWEAIVATAEDAFGGLDIAYLNAGVTTGEGNIAALTDKQYRRIMRANVDGVVFGARAVIPPIAKRGGGAIVATASLAGLIAFPPDPIYNMTKHAVVGFIRGIAPQLQAQGITANCVCPGIVATGLVNDEARTRLESAGFVLIEPEEIAAAVLECVTGTATGQAVVCQAGRDPLAYEFRDVPGPRQGQQRDFRAIGMDQ